MATREELLAEAKAKLERENLIAEAKAKLASENSGIKSEELPEQVETGIRSALSSATLGVTEPIVSAGNVLAEKAMDLYFAQKDKELGLPETQSKSLSELYSQDVERRRALQQKHPMTDISAQIGGALLPVSPAAALFKGASGAAKGIGLGEVLAGKTAPVVGSTLGTLVGKAGEEALAGAAGAGLSALGQEAILGETGFLKPGEAPSIGEQMLSGAKFGAVIGAAPSAAKLVKEGASKAAKSGLAVLGGVKKETIDEFLLRKDAILAAPTREETVDQINQFLGTLRKRVSDAKDTEDEAQKAFDLAVNDIRGALREKKLDLADMRNAAAQEFRAAAQEQKALLRAVRPPKEMVDDVLGALEESKQKLVAESNKASAMLEGAKEKIAVRPIIDQLKEEMSKQVMHGQVVGDKATYKELETLAGQLEKFPELISIEDTRKLMKNMDKHIDWSVGKADFNPELSAALKPIRGALRETIGTLVKPYDKHMKEVVAPLAESHERFFSTFGNKDTLPSKLANIIKPNNFQELDDLYALGKLTKKDFGKQLSEYQKAQQTLADPAAMRELEKSLAEYLPVKSAQEQISTMKRVDEKALIDQLAAQTRQAEMLKRAQMEKDAAKEITDRFSFFNEMNSTKKAQEIVLGKNREAAKRLEELGTMAEKPFMQWLKDSETLGAFDKEFRIGMRNVGLWGAMGSLGAMASGGDNDLLGIGKNAALGAVVGGVVDRFGPRITRKILEQVATIQGTPTVQKIQRLDLPPAAKEYLANDLARVLQKKEAVEKTYIKDPADRAAMIKDVKESEAMSKTEKALAITKLNKSGEFEDIQKLVGIKDRPIRQQTFAKKPEESPTLKSMSDALKSKREAF